MARIPGNSETNTSTNNFLLIFLALTLAFLALIMYPYTTDIYSLPKTTFFYIATVGLLFAYLYQAVRIGTLRIYRSSLDLPMAIFVFCAVLSLFLSDAPIVGLVGKYGRYEGLPSALCYAVIYFITVQVVRNENDFETLIKIMALAFIPIGVYGIFQALGYDFPTVLRFESRVHSTFGNPIMFGAYLAMMLPLLAGLGRNAKEESWRLISWALLIVGFINIVGTGSRGAWFGIGVAILLACFMAYRSKIRKQKIAAATKRSASRQQPKNTTNKRFALALLIIVLIATSLFAFTNKGIEKQIESTFSLPEGSVAVRIEIWKSVLSMLKSRPLTGYGLEQMGYRFAAHETSKYSDLTKGVVSERTHNDLLQVGIDVGVLGILAYLWIVAIVAFRVCRNSAGTAYSATLACAIIAYAVQAQTGITAVYLSPIVWSLLGSSSSILNTGKPHAIYLNKRFKLKPVMYAAGVGCLAFMTIAFLPFVADQHIFKGQQKAIASSGLSTFSFAAPEYDAAIAVFPYQNTYNKAAVEYYLDYAAQFQSPILAKSAAFIASEGLKINANDFDLTYYVGEANFLDYRLSDSDSALSEAERYFLITQRLHPHYYPATVRLLRIAMLKEERGKAIKLAERLIKQGIENPDAYSILAWDAKRKGDLNKAQQYLKKMQALPLDSSSLKGIH